MAKKSMIEREAKKAFLVNKHRKQRVDFKNKLKAATDFDVIMGLQSEIRALPLNSNPVRHSTRCCQCGRAHAVYRKFGLCRICLRQQLMIGNVTGGRKSSW